MLLKPIFTNVTLFGIMFGIINTANAVPNINQCVKNEININDNRLITIDLLNYKTSLSKIIEGLRNELSLNKNNAQNICNVLQMRVNNNNEDLISLYIDQENAYLYAVQVNHLGTSRYYGDENFLAPISNNSKFIFNIAYPNDNNFLKQRSAYSLGQNHPYVENNEDAKKIFFNLLTILEASKMPSIEATMEHADNWNNPSNAYEILMSAKKNYLQQYKCISWLANSGRVAAIAQYSYLETNYVKLTDGIKSVYDLTDWYVNVNAQDIVAKMKYIKPSYAPQKSRNIQTGQHPCTLN